MFIKDYFKNQLRWKNIFIQLLILFQPCDINADCINYDGSFECICHSGYLKNGDACDNIDECQAESSCPANSECYDTDGSYYCECLDGYVFDEDKLCQDVDECSNGEHDCDANAYCINIAGKLIVFNLELLKLMS